MTQAPKRPRLIRDRYGAGASGGGGLAKKLLPIDPQAADKARGGRAMVMLEKLDEWLEAHTGGAVDATLLGCVGGVADI